MPTPYVYPCEVLRVIDGDTLYVSLDLGFHIYMHEYVRLMGLNAPEMLGVHAEQAGRDAKQFVIDWLNQNPGPHIFASQRYDQREKYGRALGIITTKGGQSLNDALVLAGHAKETKG